MWTPKRILLLLGGFSLFLMFYGIYAYFFGAIDGLPPLPDGWGYCPDDIEVIVQPPREMEADRKLRLSFGGDCPELNCTIKVEVKSKGMVFASNQFNILQDGRVRLKPFSIGLFGKNKKVKGLPEINTVRSDEAYLTFDRPISNIADMGNRKIVGGELRGDITIVNNRKTLQKNDDIEVHIYKAPLFYQEKTNLISSEGLVRLVDTQPKPHPTIITAIGLKIHLTKKGKKEEKKLSDKTDKIRGVSKVVLQENVDMHFHIDADSGFLGNPKGGKKEENKILAKGTKKEKSHVQILTLGRFVYDVQKDFAIFESPPNSAAAKKNRAFPSDQVEVKRIHNFDKGKLWDQLLCDRLELQFQKKEQDTPRGSNQGPTAGREIAHAHATSRGKNEVVLAMDTENLIAHGRELIYKSPVGDKGPEMILNGDLEKGLPMWAVKDAHKITAARLHMVGANAEGEGQHAYAQGPGEIDLIDPKSKTKKHTYHAQWKKSLVVTKDREKGKEYDLLIFTDDAAFIDDNDKQTLRANQIKVWLEQAERKNAKDRAKEKKQVASGAPRQQPHKLIGFGGVKLTSPDLRINKCEHLIVRFVKAAESSLPEELPTAAAGTSDSEVRVLPKSKGILSAPRNAETTKKHVALRPQNREFTAKNQGAPNAPEEPSIGSLPVPTRKKQQQETEKPKAKRHPIELEARQVSVYVARLGGKNELQEVVTEGEVYVTQEGKKPGEKAVDIRGETLNLLHHQEGDTLIVFGNQRNPAQLQLGELVLVGPKVTINQRDNTANIEGVGAMQVPSNTTFDGAKPTKPGTRLTIEWNRDMFFNGKDATFRGGVAAYQENAKLLCQTMQVALDKTVSLKEGQKANKGAKVERLICDRNVKVEDVKKTEKGKFARYDRLEAQQLKVDNQTGPVIASGPLAKVFILQFGRPKITPTSRPKTGGFDETKKKQLFLTRVDYNGWLHSYKKGEQRIAKFFDNVEVYHLPANSWKVKINPDRLPKDGMYMRCEKLEIYSRPEADGSKSQDMIGRTNVLVLTPEFRGRADKVRYIQATDVVIFEGTEGNKAYLEKFRGPGVPPQQARALKIIYNRRTQQFSVNKGTFFKASGN